jgi:hypothetical protein
MIKTANHTIELADEEGSEAVRIFDSNRNKVTLDATGIAIEDGNGNRIKLDASGIVIEGPTIKIGAAAAENLVKGQSLVTLLASWHKALLLHTHPVTLVAATPSVDLPLSLLEPALGNFLSTRHSVE